MSMKRASNPVIVSACLLGVASRYDGTAAEDVSLIRHLAQRAVIPVCPEQLGGLPTPRPPSEITEGSGEDVLDGKSSVMSEDGRDVTANYLAGAREVLKLATVLGAREAYLKRCSPACGWGQIKRGGLTVPGNGVCAALLARHRIRLIASGQG